MSSDWGSFSVSGTPTPVKRGLTVSVVLVLILASLISFAFGLVVGWMVSPNPNDDGFVTLPTTIDQVLKSPLSSTDTAPTDSQSPVLGSGALQEEEQIVMLVNDARTAQGLAVLRINPLLTRTALSHSQDQATQRLLTHDGSDGTEVADRVTKAGYKWRIVGENVLLQHEQDAGEAFLGWWSSPPHQKNMMNQEFQEIGVAFAIDTDGAYYYTMVLATP